MFILKHVPIKLFLVAVNVAQQRQPRPQQKA